MMMINCVGVKPWLYDYKSISDEARARLRRAADELAKVRQEVDHVYKMSEFLLISETNKDGVPHLTETEKLLQKNNDNQAYFRTPQGKEYYCNQYTYFSYSLKRKMDDEKSFSYNQQHRNMVIAGNYEYQCEKPRPGMKQTAENGCGGFLYNFMQCMIEMAKDLPENTLIETDKGGTYIASYLNDALDFQNHEANNLSRPRRRVKGEDHRKKEMAAELERICEERSIHVFLGRFAEIVCSEKLSRDYGENRPNKVEPIDPVFHIPVLTRYHISEYDQEFYDGHHEIRKTEEKMEIVEKELSRTEHKTEYGFMKVKDIDYYLYDVKYADGTKGKWVHCIVDSD